MANGCARWTSECRVSTLCCFVRILLEATRPSSPSARAGARRCSAPMLRYETSFLACRESVSVPAGQIHRMSRTGSCSALGDVANFVAGDDPVQGSSVCDCCRSRQDLDESVAMGPHSASLRKRLHTMTITKSHTHTRPDDNTTGNPARRCDRRTAQRLLFFPSCWTTPRGADCPSARRRSMGGRCAGLPAFTVQGLPEIRDQVATGVKQKTGTAEPYVTAGLRPRLLIALGAGPLAEVHGAKPAWLPPAQGRSFTQCQ